MYIGYELKLEKRNFNGSIEELASKGISRYDAIKTQIETKIKSFIQPNGSLDGSKMQANWFPQISADVFISHSHKDEELAIAFSQWLNEKFGLNVFIDSCVWGYADELLKLIDNEYCLNLNSESYNYTKRNYSTSHVHMMLSTALSMMIDKTECIIFLNTPNSITTDNVISKTESPWIYSEIATTQFVRKNSLRSYRGVLLAMSLQKGGRVPIIEHKIDYKHLTSLDVNNLKDWCTQWPHKGKKYSSDHKQYALDVLYNITLKN